MGAISRRPIVSANQVSGDFGTAGTAIAGSRGPRRKRTIYATLAAISMAAGVGCNAFKNGFLNPSLVGTFEREVTLDIRTSLSLQDVPEGLTAATEPTPDDLIPYPEQYRFGPGDQINVRIFELLARGAESTSNVMIDVNGYISLPVLGRIDMSGLTLYEIEEEIKAVLEQRGIVKEPEVVVTPLLRRRMSFTLYGATNAPNLYPLPTNDLRLLQALTVAGGLNQAVSNIMIIREWTLPDETDEFAPDPGDELEIPPADVVTPDFVYGSVIGRTAHTASYAPLPAPQGTPLESEPPTTGPREPVDDPEAEIIEATVGTPEQAAPQADRPEPESTEPGAVEPPAKKRSNFMFLNGAWVEIATEPTPEQRTAPGGVPPAGPADDVAPPVTGPVVDWSQVAGTTREPRVIRVSAEGLRNGDMRQNIIVRPGDMIRLDAGSVGEYYMAGQVGRPGAYSLTGRQVTLKTAIAAAGGLGALAWPTRCAVYRRLGDREQVLQVDLDRIFGAQDPDFFLKPNDLIMVGSHPVAPFLAVARNAFRFSWGLGFVFDRNFGDQFRVGGKPNPAFAPRRFPGLFP